MSGPASHHGIVESAEWLTPSMRRIVLGGPGLAAFTPTEHTDQYVNALFVPDGATYEAPFDVDEARTQDPEHRPRGRRYTVRRWDDTTRQLTLDFVAHGDVGYAGRWAQRAAPGDALQVLGPGGGYAPHPHADWHLLAGDESALPAIAASLESMTPSSTAAVFIVVDGPDHEIELDGPEATTISWLHRNGSASPADLLVDAIRAFSFPPGSPQLFVHGEAGETRAVRQHLLSDRGLARDGASISPYWRRHHTDEAWRAVKKQWLADQEADVSG
ncbi:MAG: siderophore-interacting protein [Actinomycetota bacterium]